MALFYDPPNRQDLDRVVALLRENGIEHSLRAQPAGGLGPAQIHVAEEDLPRAEELLVRAQMRTP